MKSTNSNCVISIFEDETNKTNSEKYPKKCSSVVFSLLRVV